MEKITSDTQLFLILDAFQTYGFAGTSLSRISEATGLIKASLYHRFPGGKEQIAEAVLHAVDQRFAEILAPIDEPGLPWERMQRVCTGLREFYADGRRACLLETMTLAGGPPSMREHTRRTLAFWVESFAAMGHECGLTKNAASEAAQEAIGALEGALILCRIQGTLLPFQRVLDSLPRRLGAAPMKTA